jgi:ABC-type branched-subunit amino acid transport system permease subunit
MTPSLSQYIFFLLLGLATGGIYSLLGTGLVLKYRSSGVVDFSHAAVAMFIAYVYIELHAYGQLVFPWVVIPHAITLSSKPWGTLPALLVGLAYAALLGALLYVLVFRPLRNAPQLIRVSASVGIMIYLQAVAVLNFGSISVATNPILPSGSVHVLGIPPIPVSSLWLSGIAIALTATVAAIYRFTRFGLATRAAAENEQGAAVIGLSSDRIAGGNWIIASVLAGFAGIMIAPLDQVAPSFATLFLVPVFGIALVARFRSFAIATAAAFALAMLQSELAILPSLLPNLSTGWQQALPQAVPFVVVIVAMMALSRGIGARGEERAHRNPSLGYPQRPYLTTAAMFGAGLIALALFHALLDEALLYSIGIVCVGLSVVVLTGYIGQISLAQMSLAAVSAILLTHLTVSVGIGFPFTLLIASLAAVPLGLVIGLPALRLRGVNLAVVTLAAASVVDVIFTDWTSFAGGLAGLKVPHPTLFGWNVGIQQGHHYPRLIFGVVALAIVCLVGLMVARLRRSPAGRMMIAVRSNERAAAAAGIDVARAKLFAFALSAWIAGIGGCLLAYQGQIVSPTTFASGTSLALLAVVMVAGLGRIAGAVVAGVMLSANGLLVTFLNVQLGIGNYQLVVAGLALTLTAIANPNGIAANPPPPLVWAARRIGGLIPGGWGPPPRARLAGAAAGASASPAERNAVGGA